MDQLQFRRLNRLRSLNQYFVRQVIVDHSFLSHFSCLPISSQQRILSKESDAAKTWQLTHEITGRDHWFPQFYAALVAGHYTELVQALEVDEYGSLLSSDTDFTTATPPLPPQLQGRFLGNHQNFHHSVGTVPPPLHTQQDKYHHSNERFQQQNQYLCQVSQPYRGWRPDARANCPPRSYDANTLVQDLPFAVWRKLDGLDKRRNAADNWQDFAAQLDFTLADVKAIDSMDLPTRTLVERWSAADPQGATLGELLRIIRNMRRADVATEIERIVNWQGESERVENQHSFRQPDGRPGSIVRPVMPVYSSASRGGASSRSQPECYPPMNVQDQQEKLMNIQRNVKGGFNQSVAGTMLRGTVQAGSQQEREIVGALPQCLQNLRLDNDRQMDKCDGEEISKSHTAKVENWKLNCERKHLVSDRGEAFAANALDKRVLDHDRNVWSMNVIGSESTENNLRIANPPVGEQIDKNSCSSGENGLHLPLRSGTSELPQDFATTFTEQCHSLRTDSPSRHSPLNSLPAYSGNHVRTIQTKSAMPHLEVEDSDANRIS